jgi:hypothetical protein
MRFIRLESHDTRKSQGAEYSADAWRDTATNQVRYVRIGVNPNEDEDELNRSTVPRDC